MQTDIGSDVETVSSNTDLGQDIRFVLFHPFSLFVHNLCAVKQLVIL